MRPIKGGTQPFAGMSFKATPRGCEGKMNFKLLTVEPARAAGANFTSLGVLNRNLNLQSQSGRGLPHSKTLRAIRESSVNAKRPGVRRPSAAFNLLRAIRG